MKRTADGAVLAAVAGAVVAALMTLPGLGVGTLWDNSETAYGEVAKRDSAPARLGGHASQRRTVLRPAAALLLDGRRLLAARRTNGVCAATSVGAGNDRARRIYRLCRCAASGSSRRNLRRGDSFDVLDASGDRAAGDHGRAARPSGRDDDLLVVSRARNRRSDRYAIYGWIAAGARVSCKGPRRAGNRAAGHRTILSFGIGVTSRRIRRRRARGSLGIFAFVAIAAPWPIALVLHYHLFPLQKLIGEYTIGRYTGVVENQSGPIWYYVPVIILGFFPWIAFLPMAIVYGVRCAARRAAGSRPLAARSSWLLLGSSFRCSSLVSRAPSFRTTSRSSFPRSR